MLSFEEAIFDLQEAADEFLKHLASSSTPKEMPPDLPPVAQRLWGHCKGILIEIKSKEFEEIAP